MNLNIISKYRNEIYGFSIIWIVLFHGAAINNVDYSFGFSVLYPLQAFLSIGNVGVDIFLFLSGVCLYFFVCKKQRHLFVWEEEAVENRSSCFDYIWRLLDCSLWGVC